MDNILSQLKKHRLLLKQDKFLPNVVSLMTGESLTVSWWSHPQAQDIFNMLDILSGHPDVLLTKLVNGKDTFVHRSLWPELAAVGMGREKWQMDKLPGPAKELLREIDEQGFTLRSGTDAKELQKLLLINAKQVHTEAGKHSFMLQSWQAWLAEHPVAVADSPGEARLKFDDIIEGFGASKTLLPWNH